MFPSTRARVISHDMLIFKVRCCYLSTNSTTKRLNFVRAACFMYDSDNVVITQIPYLFLEDMVARQIMWLPKVEGPLFYVPILS
jgi:hypothetical protein